MAKELSKQIMKRSKSKNLYFKWPSRKNLLIYKNEKNIWNYMTKYAENRFFENQQQKKVANYFGMQPNPFLLIEES